MTRLDDLSLYRLLVHPALKPIADEARIRLELVAESLKK
jgi:hypothetical protein